MEDMKYIEDEITIEEIDKFEEAQFKQPNLRLLGFVHIGDVYKQAKEYHIIKSKYSNLKILVKEAKEVIEEFIAFKNTPNKAFLKVISKARKTVTKIEAMHKGKG